MSLKQLACEYLNRGWSVLPVKGKRPVIVWKQLQERRATPEEISNWPDHDGLGVVTGKISGITVLDVDGAQGLSSLANKHLPITRIAKTKRGIHYYYQYDPEIKNSAGKVDDGLDTRNDGGYVVVPPTPNYAWVCEEPLAAVPVWLKMSFRDSERRPRAYDRLKSPPIVAGERNVVLASFVGLIKNYDFRWEIAFGACLGIQQFFEPPMTDNEIKQVVDSIYRYKE